MEGYSLLADEIEVGQRVDNLNDAGRESVPLRLTADREDFSQGNIGKAIETERTRRRSSLITHGVR